MSGTTVRPLERGDEAEWRRLWHAYLAFYDTKLPDAQYADTFERLLGDDPHQPFGMIAERGARPVGLVHALFHAHCWRPQRSCYLQDLFADPEARGAGVGRALIEAVVERAAGEGGPVYWITGAGNETARRLYDRVAKEQGVVMYERAA